MKYQVTLTRATCENKDVLLEARSEEEAAEMALNLEHRDRLPEKWEPADWCGRTVVDSVEEEV